MCLRSLLVFVCSLCLSLNISASANDFPSTSSKQLSSDEVGITNSRTPTAISCTGDLALSDKQGDLMGSGAGSIAVASHHEVMFVNNAWVTKQSMPTARYGMATAAVNGKVYAAGGHGGLNTVEEYDPVTDTWTTKTSMPTGRGAVAAAVVNGKIYAIGGWVSPVIYNAVEEYDPLTDTWTTKPPMPTARYALATAAVNGKIYAIGGYDGSSYVGTVEEFDPQTNSWSTKQPMPTGRYILGAAVVDGKIYAVGGSYTNAALAAVEEYDPQTDTWTTRQAMPTARDGVSVTSVDGKIYAIGGATVQDVVNTVEEFEPASNVWRAKQSMPTARWYSGVTVVNGRIYVIGGAHGGTTFAAVEEYTPVLDPTFGTVIDIDGNLYQTVTIGGQVWMAENLKVTHYRNGDAIPLVADPIAWNHLADGAYCEYDNNTGNVAIYGRLYNWFAIGDSRGVAPAGWHVPTDAEWQTMVDYLGGWESAGGMLKDTGTQYWTTPNTAASNASGFAGRPGGYRGGDGPFNGLGYGAGYWTATPHPYFGDVAWNRNLKYNSAEVIHDYSGKKSGVALRCVRDAGLDSDDDGVLDVADNCPNQPNSSQADANSDGIGDACCCIDVTGNVNVSGIVDLPDLSLLVAYLTAIPAPVLPCLAEANVNATGIIDLSDLSMLIAYLTATPRPTLPNCP